MAESNQTVTSSSARNVIITQQGEILDVSVGAHQGDILLTLSEQDIQVEAVIDENRLDTGGLDGSTSKHLGFQN